MNTNRLTYLYNFSVIIPHRNSISTLERAILSIPNNPDIQIIIVDNSFIPLKVEDISIDRSFEILYSNYNLGAGGARNLGVRSALGKWLLFLDSDDHFDSSAFNVFYSYLHSDNEVIFCSQAAFSSINSNSDRGNEYLRLNLDFIDKKISENQLRYQYDAVCGKMISNELVKKYRILFDEIPSGNDVFFSLYVSFYATKIHCDSAIVYWVNEIPNSITKNRSSIFLESRFKVVLKKNKFLRENGLKNYQLSVFIYLYKSIYHRKFLAFIRLIIKFRQNPFIGFSNWPITAFSLLKKNFLHKKN